MDLEVSWHADLPRSEIAFELKLESGGCLRWENVDGSFFHFRALRDGTTLREDTLRAFQQALLDGHAPPIDTRVYSLLEEAYARG